MTTPKLNIIFAITTDGSLQNKVFEGLRMQLEKKHPKKFSIKVLKAAGPYKEGLISNIKYFMPTTHAIVTVGEMASMAAKEATTGVAYPPPIVFTAVQDPVDVGLLNSLQEPEANITGVTIKAPASILPIQIIDRLMPEIKRFFLAYRKEAQNGRIAFEVEKVKDYFKARDKVVDTYELSGEELVAEQVSERLTATQGVLIPELGIYPNDAITLTKLATQNSIPVFGHMEDALKEGAIIGAKGDIEFAGVQAANYCIDLTLGKKQPHELPVYEIDGVKRIIANPEAMASYGVSFSDEILSAHDGAKEWPEIPVKEFGKVVSYKSEFDLNQNSAITKRSHKDQEAVYFSQMITGRVHDDEWQDVQTGFALDHKLQLFYCMGKKLTDMMIRKMHERDEHLPIIRSMTALESKEDTGIVTQPPVKPMTNIILPDPDPLMPLKLLLLVKPTIKTAALLCLIPEEYLTQRYVERFEKIKAFAQEQNIELTFVYEAMVAKMKERLPEVCDSHDAVFFFEDTVHEIIPDWFAGVGDRHRALVCAGTTRHLEHLPLCYGMDKMIVREKLFAPVKAIMEKNEPTEEDIVISYDECYRININPEACLKYGVNVPTGLLAVLSTQLMYANENGGTQ